MRKKIVTNNKIKKRKRAKSSTPIEESIIMKKYSVKCPHCMTFLIAGCISQNVDRLFCFHCDNPIILDWENLIIKENQL